ncbi:mRNA-capping enzyme subunit alpha [Ceratocystis platani]|uniref:mRNA-capping enzyme subunit alpha n=1 Tax=Ceratocystis fimbriata f. sp. platani TaxID=88771 RepID=A0A0F8CYI6_CERFI|nr:mRNA-capping enzyme subunit alpha [Ceratocystis platani]
MDGPIKSISEPGIKVPPKEGVHELRAEVARLLGRSQTSFPGAQPVSFTREHLRVLMMEDYYVCEKSDGIRYLLYLTTDPRGSEAHYLIDRKNDFWYNNNHNLHFPLCDDRQAFHDRTLIDGELVMDDDGDGVMVPRFLVFDCLTLGGMNLMDRTLDKRLAYFSEKVYRPYKELLTDYPDERKYLPFEVQLKDMQFAYGTEMIFNRVIPNLKHGNDGLIFTCRNTPYKHGTDPHILKWKPPEENTVDCRLRLIFPMMTPDDEDIAEGITEPYHDYDLPPKSELWKFMGDSGPNKYTYFRDVYISNTPDQKSERKQKASEDRAPKKEGPPVTKSTLRDDASYVCLDESWQVNDGPKNAKGHSNLRVKSSGIYRDIPNRHHRTWEYINDNFPAKNGGGQRDNNATEGEKDDGKKGTDNPTPPEPVKNPDEKNPGKKKDNKEEENGNDEADGSKQKEEKQTKTKDSEKDSEHKGKHKEKDKKGKEKEKAEGGKSDAGKDSTGHTKTPSKKDEGPSKSNDTDSSTDAPKNIRTSHLSQLMKGQGAGETFISYTVQYNRRLLQMSPFFTPEERQHLLLGFLKPSERDVRRNIQTLSFFSKWAS